MYREFKEVQRLANLLPMNLPHETLRDVQIGEWHLPAETGVIAQISTVMYDEKVRLKTLSLMGFLFFKLHPSEVCYCSSCVSV